MTASVLTANYGVQGSNTSSHPITFPSGTAVSDLLILAIATDGNTTVTESGATWADLKQLTGAANANKLSVFAKRVTAGDVTTGSVTISTSGNEQSVGRIWRIGDFYDDATITNIVAVSTGIGSGGTNQPDPDTVTPPWGSGDYLGIAVCGHDNGNVTMTGFPSEVSNTFSDESGGTVGCGLGTGYAQFAGVSSINPSAFTMSATEQFCVCTIAVRSASVPDMLRRGTLMPRKPNVTSWRRKRESGRIGGW